MTLDICALAKHESSSNNPVEKLQGVQDIWGQQLGINRLNYGCVNLYLSLNYYSLYKSASSTWVGVLEYALSTPMSHLF